MIKLLNTSYPFLLGKKETFRVIFLIGIFVFLVCLLFRPFGLNNYSLNKLFLLSLINGLVVVCSLLISQRAFSYFFRNQNENNWTILKEVAAYFWHLMVLCLIVFLFNYTLDPSGGRASDWLLFSVTRVLLASFVIIPIVVLLKKNFILIKTHRDQVKIAQIIKQKSKQEP
jgi:hypothetical protein